MNEELEYEATKRCSKCEEIKFTTEFYKASRNNDGLQSRCKQCSTETNKEWREGNPEYHKQWREDNPDYLKQWIEGNPEYYKQWHQGLKEGYSLYVIQNIFNEVYVGVTEFSIEFRFRHHINNTNRAVRNEDLLLPIYHSLHTHGVENHTLSLYRYLGDVTREVAEAEETRLIQKFEKRGYTMLNIRKRIK